MVQHQRSMCVCRAKPFDKTQLRANQNKRRKKRETQIKEIRPNQTTEKKVKLLLLCENVRQTIDIRINVEAPVWLFRFQLT